MHIYKALTKQQSMWVPLSSAKQVRLQDSNVQSHVDGEVGCSTETQSSNSELAISPRLVPVLGTSHVATLDDRSRRRPVVVVRAHVLPCHYRRRTRMSDRRDNLAVLELTHKLRHLFH